MVESRLKRRKGTRCFASLLERFSRQRPTAAELEAVLVFHPRPTTAELGVARVFRPRPTAEALAAGRVFHPRPTAAELGAAQVFRRQLKQNRQRRAGLALR
jgi:hypothetical protein